MKIREMFITDYDAALALWHRCAGMGLSDADELVPLSHFLERNPGLNFIALDGESLVGTVLCGTDGRRGYLYHLAVDPLYRRRGIGRELVAGYSTRCVYKRFTSATSWSMGRTIQVWHSGSRTVG